MIVSYLPEPQEHPLWDAIERILTPAVSERPILEAGEVVWIAHEDGMLFGAGTTALSEDEQTAVILACGGTRHREWVGEALRIVEAWARDAGASRLTMRGRRGWARSLCAAGWDCSQDGDEWLFKKELTSGQEEVI